MLLWWQLAVTQSQREMTKPQAHQSKAPLCSCPKCTGDEKVKVHSSLVGSPLGGDWKSFLPKEAVSVVVVHLLLMLAGDVETNPGPGENIAYTFGIGPSFPLMWLGITPASYVPYKHLKNCL